MSAPSIDRVVVALDLFPANATVASTTYQNVRAVIADGILQLYTLGPSGPQVVYERPVEGPLGGSIVTGVEVPTVDGLIWIEQGGGCGCGSQLKIADLFPGRQRVMTGLR